MLRPAAGNRRRHQPRAEPLWSTVDSVGRDFQALLVGRERLIIRKVHFMPAKNSIAITIIAFEVYISPCKA